jgi:hypothetical protein
MPSTMQYRLPNEGFDFIDGLTLRWPGARLRDVRVAAARVPDPRSWETPALRLAIEGDQARLRFERPDNWSIVALEVVCDGAPDPAGPQGRLDPAAVPDDAAIRARLATRRIAFLGTARDCAAALPASIAKLHELGRLFAHAEIHVYENDSADGTGELLDAMQRDGLLVAHREAGIAALMPARTERLAHGRNRLLDHVFARGRWDYVAWADLDGLVGPRFAVEGFVGCFRHEAAWDAVFPLSHPIYYDIWALREDHFAPGDYVADGRHRLHAALQDGRQLHAAVQLLAPGKVRGWIPVRSAFGGFGLYKADAARRGRYVGLRGGEEVCEHVPYHEALVAAGCRLWINPGCLTHVA